VNPTRIRNTIIWTIRVPVMLTFHPLFGIEIRRRSS
jgi:hypothetical protein